jgi:hypothetical protein
LFRAAEIRQHDPVLEGAKNLEGEIPHIPYFITVNVVVSLQ